MRKNTGNIIVGLEKEQDFCTIDVDLLEYESSARFVVEKGCVAKVLIGKYETQLRSSEAPSIQTVLDINNIKKKFMQKYLPCQIIVCKEKITGFWGVSGIPYCDQNGVTGTCGYYGSITYLLRDAAKAKQELDGLSEEEIGVNIVEAFNRKHLERILKKELEKYQWDKNEERLCDAVKVAYQKQCTALQMSIDIADISFDNLDEPALSEEYHQNIADKREQEERRQEERNRLEKEKVEKQEKEQKQQTSWTCSRCKTVWQNDGNYCLKCGTERK